MENKIFWVALALVVLGVAFVLFQPAVEERLAPELESAWVAVEAEGSGVAEVGRVELDLETPFTLRAVVGARDRDGEPVYYTEAEALRIAGLDIPAEQVRRWDRRRKIKLRWFTLEGRWPYLPLAADEGIAAFQIQPFLRSEWPLAWSIPGEIDAANDDHIESEGPLTRQLFGTQRYHVRFELYRGEDDMVPENVIRSWAVEELREQVDHFPTVIRTDAGPAAPAMRVFGLTQLGLPAEPPEGLSGRIDELARHGIAFSRATVLRDLLAGAGRRFAELEWRVVDLEGEAAWGDDVSPGDLLRVGDRIVVLYEDRGQAGSLDYGDLCFDFVQGAEVRQLSGVFAGEGEAVEHARLLPSPRASSP